MLYFTASTPSQAHQTLYASMLKLCYHPDLNALNRFDRLMLAFSRWSYFLLINLISQKLEKSQNPQLISHIEEWKSLNLDPIETRLIEVLVLCGKGPAKCPLILASRLKFLSDLTNLSLAKYEMVNHPRDPMRLTKISSLLTSLETIGVPQTMVLMFQGNITAVTSVINSVFLYQ